MPTDIVIPQAGESVTSGVISRWLKNEGDVVKRDEDVLELETDKVTMGVPAPASGVLKVVVPAGETVTIGQVVGRVTDSPGGGPNGAVAPKAPSAPAPTGKSPPAATPAKAPAAKAAPEARPGNDVRATPLARKTAQDMGVDLTRVPATGAGQRVRESDVVSYAQTREGPGPADAAEKNIAAVTGAIQTRGGAGGITRQATRERLSPLRQRIAQRLVEAQHSAAMLTTFNECDMTGVMALRAKYKEDFEKKHGVGLGFMSFFVRAAVNALRAFPMVNASLVDDGAGGLAVEKHDYCDVAIAVASPKGLVVPVIRNCENLTFAQIELAVKDFGQRAKDGKLTLEEMQGGTFTITNGGVFGSLMSTPILNPPQSAILGMHAFKNRAVEDPTKPGQLALRPMMYLAVSYDHRIIDGSEAVRFLVRIKDAIEDPGRLILDL